MTEQHTLSSSLLQTGEDVARFVLKSPVEVQHALRALIKSSAMASIYFNNDSEFLVTTLLEIDVKNGSLIFDVSSDTEANKKLAIAAAGNFLASPDGIKIQFSTGKIKPITYKGNPAFSAALPTQLIKMQRREYYRIQTPVVDPFICTMRNPQAGIINLRLFDISLGGVGLILPNMNVENFPLFAIYAQVRLNLQDFGEATVDLQARNHVNVTLKNGKQMMRLGCRFLKLPARQEALLQRVIAHLERERNALSGD